MARSPCPRSVGTVLVRGCACTGFQHWISVRVLCAGWLPLCVEVHPAQAHRLVVTRYLDEVAGNLDDAISGPRDRGCGRCWSSAPTLYRLLRRTVACSDSGCRSCCSPDGFGSCLGVDLGVGVAAGSRLCLVWPGLDRVSSGLGYALLGVVWFRLDSCLGSLALRPCQWLPISSSGLCSVLDVRFKGDPSPVRSSPHAGRATVRPAPISRESGFVVMLVDYPVSLGRLLLLVGPVSGPTRRPKLHQGFGWRGAVHLVR